MSEKTKEFYEFKNFRLDLIEKVLEREGETIALTPKVFETLCVLVKNAGRLLEKAELMQLIWPDRFVDEGNLTFNVRMLRQALGDDAQNPQFIETVPRRGYRFIATVKKGGAASQPENDLVMTEPKIVSPIARYSPPSNRPKLFNFSVSVAALVLLIGVVGFSSWYARNKSFGSGAPVLSAPFSSEKLSTDGKVTLAVISPDGKTVLYRNENGGQQSLWLRQLASANNTELIPPSEDVYYGLKYAPAGDFIYFGRGGRDHEHQADIYRTPIFGGVPVKVVSDTQGWFSISPDGAKISFVRCYRRDEENCSLWIADAENGRNAQKLAARPRPFRISANDFSPDGKNVAFAVGQSENQANAFELHEVNIESGAERELTPEKFFDIKGLAWLPDQDSLLMVASRIPNRRFRLWQISQSDGGAVPLTNDSEDYAGLSVDKTASLIVATQIKADFKLLLRSTNNTTDARALFDATTASFAPNGTILFASMMSGNEEIWSCDTNGGNLRQLTNDAGDDSDPLAAPNDDSVFFSSNRTGMVQVWRMNADGSNQTQITRQEGGFPIALSADARWIYYLHGVQRTLWRAPADGSGAEELVLNKQKYRFAFSPDKSQVAFSEKQDETRILTVVSLVTGQTLKTFRAPIAKARIGEITWLPDGKTLVYTLTDSNYLKEALWQQPLDAETPVQIADLGDQDISSLALNPDSQSFAVVQGVWKHDAVLLKGLK